MGGNRVAVRALGEGPYELVLRCEGAGEQRFSEFTLEALARAIGRFSPFTTHSHGADGPGTFYVDAPALDVVRHGANLTVGAVVERLTPERAAHEGALARAGDLLRGYQPLPVRRAATVAWLRETPPEQWPPLKIKLTQAGTPILADGNHRLVVARELGVEQLPAQIRTIDGVVERRVGVDGQRLARRSQPFRGLWSAS